jgi:thymidylate synthase ThyX
MTKTTISAKVVADSISPKRHRITSLELVMPRYVLSEFNTHRMFSRNSASSRAIPFEKMLKVIQEDPFIPIAWMKDHKGMQGNEYFTNEEFGEKSTMLITEGLERLWLQTRDNCYIQASLMSKLGLTKQIVNRLLEPFMWHKVLVTATEFENFFALRYSEFADIHMQELAKCMLEAMNNSTPRELKEGAWHIPYVDDDMGISPFDNCTTKDYIKITVARCARTSYTIIGEEDKKYDYKKDIELHDRLLASGHMSPFEHIARVMTEEEYYSYFKGIRRIGKDNNDLFAFEEYLTGEDTSNEINEDYLGWCHNFRGFISYRSTIQGENKTDNRLIKK